MGYPVFLWSTKKNLFTVIRKEAADRIISNIYYVFF